jgi:hypothetical protein
MIEATITLDSAMREAIAAHQKAWTAVQALGDDVDDKTLDRASRVESDAMIALANTPCRSANELHDKLRYILGFKLETEDAPMEGDGYGALAITLRCYFERPDAQTLGH